MINYSNSIFAYATSELSQDAFICWLCSFLLKENKGTDLILEECAYDFIKSFLPDFCRGDVVSYIQRQVNITYRVNEENKEAKYKKGLIDVLLTINGKKIVIEDKTFTSTHNDQINHYKEGLINDGIDEKDIICVYYKTLDQPYPEANVDFEFNRRKLLDIFEKYESKTKNDIFLGYLLILQDIEEKVNNYKSLPIDEWDGTAYIGFYKEVCETKLKPEGKEYCWKKVNNPSGGFWGLWWSGIGRDDIAKTKLSKDIVAIYPQFEEKKLAIKIQIEKGENKDTIKGYCKSIQDYLKECLGSSYKKLDYRYGNYMTLAYIDDYNYDNYVEKMNMIENIIIGVLERFK